MEVCISNQAYKSIVTETHAYPNTETGGIFLGKKENNSWYIIEVIDPGYNRVLRQSSYFEYDEIYVSHLSNVRARLYKHGLDLMGLWHRHPGSFDRFSGTDDDTHRSYIQQYEKRGIISSLVNLDPGLRMTHYYIDAKIKHKKISRVNIGDKYIPKEFLQLVDLSVYNSIKSRPEIKVEKNSIGFNDEFNQDSPSQKPLSFLQWLGFNRKNIKRDLSRKPSATYSFLTEELANDVLERPASNKKTSEEVLDILMGSLEKECEYLKFQSIYDYSYRYNYEESVIDIHLSNVGAGFASPNYPKNIETTIFLKNKVPYFKIGEYEKPYKENYIERYINYVVRQKNRGIPK